MEYNELMAERLSVLESRMATVEQQIFLLMQSHANSNRKPRRELTPEEKAAVRARLVAGQEKARASRASEWFDLPSINEDAQPSSNESSSIITAEDEPKDTKKTKKA